MNATTNNKERIKTMARKQKQISQEQLDRINRIKYLTDKMKEIRTDYNRLKKGRKEVFKSFMCHNPKKVDRQLLDQMFEVLTDDVKNQIQVMVQG
jgi:hypothetical protein